MVSGPVDKKPSLRRLRWLVFGATMIVAAIAGANGIVIAQLHQNTLRDVQNDLLRQSLTLSELAERSLQNVDLMLTSVAEKVRLATAADGGRQQVTGDDFHNFLQEKRAALPQIAGIGVTDANGTRLNQTRDAPSSNRDLSKREYFQALLKNPKLKSYIGEPSRGSLSGDWVIVMSRPVLSDDGRFLGAVFASTKMAYFEDLFRATALGDGYAATLLRRDGTLLARFPRAGQVGAVVPASVLNKLTGNARSAVSRSVSPVDGEPRIAAAYSLSNYPLVLVVTQNEQSAFASWRTTLVTMCLIALTMIAIILVAAWLIARSWTQQERLLAARAAVVDSDKVRALAEAELHRQRDLAEQSQRFAAAVENMTHGLCMFDKDSRLVVCNESFARMYNLPAQLREPGTYFRDIIDFRFRNSTLKGGKDATALQKQLAVLSGLSPDRASSRVDEHKSGRLIRVSRQPLPGGGWVATHDDITKQRRAEQELNDTKQFLDSIIENIPISVVVKDVSTRKFVLVNRTFQAMLGLDREQLLGKTVFDFYNARTAEFIHNTDNEFLRDSSADKYKEYDVDTRSDGSRVYATNRIVIRDGDGDPKYLVVVIEDVTERKKAEQRIAFMAHHDALTGLANRAAIAQRIEEAAARQRRWGDPFTVLMLDLDRFKHVNDTLGHSAGDALLREAATRLKTLLRETDELARLGGDEFAIIQSGETDQREAARALADRIIEIVGRTFNLDGNEINIGTSIGIALAPEHGTNPDNLLKMADMALYSAKSSGRNGHRFFDPNMGAAADARLALENELRRAINQSEFELHYQPILDAKTLRICSAEALVRWRHPSKGLVAPDNFIPLAEDTGMIVQIGEWVLRTACADAARWPDGIKVAVNLSPVQFRKTNLSDIVLDALAEAELAPTRLELEITETALIESAAECLPALHRFKQAGIAVALDDFGTGYSSLSQLAMFPFDRIKIDKSFTQNLTKRTECAAIISATLTLAQNLDIATTAEGVETKEQFQLLKLAGVTSLQGYFFQRPRPLAEIDFNASYEDGAAAKVA